MMNTLKTSAKEEKIEDKRSGKEVMKGKRKIDDLDQPTSDHFNRCQRFSSAYPPQPFDFIHGAYNNQPFASVLPVGRDGVYCNPPFAPPERYTYQPFASVSRHGHVSLPVDSATDTVDVTCADCDKKESIGEKIVFIGKTGGGKLPESNGLLLLKVSY